MRMSENCSLHSDVGHHKGGQCQTGTNAPHPRQAEIDALRVRWMSAADIATELGIFKETIRKAVNGHDAAVPAFLAVASLGLPQQEISKRLGISAALTTTLLRKMPSDVIAKVKVADATRKLGSNAAEIQEARRRKAAVDAASKAARKETHTGSEGRPDFIANEMMVETLSSLGIVYDNVRVSM